jgi:endonuclease/exonuclease/phosphatase (EEP) superfamily protein YafD
VVIAFAWLWEYDLTRTGPLYDPLALATFLVRVLGAHIGAVGLVVLVVALVLRQWAYAAATIPVIAFLLWPVHDGLGTNGTLPEPREGEIVVMSVNLLGGAGGPEKIVRRIRSAEPDLVLLQEYSTRHQARLGELLADEFEFVAVRPGTDRAAFSHLPIRDVSNAGPTQGATRFLVDVGGGELAVFNAHFRVPAGAAALAVQRRQVAAVVEELRGETGPVIVAGDLNFTETTQQHAAFLDVGMRAGWDELRRGRGVTWSRLGGLQARVPGLRLDQVFANDLVELGAIARGDRGESDHWPIVVTLSVRDS